MAKAVKKKATKTVVTASNIFHNIMAASVKGNPKPKVQKVRNHYSLPVDDMELPIRLKVVLKKNNVNTLKELAMCDVMDLLQFKNLGTKSISLIETALDKYKLRLGDFSN